MKKSRNWNRNRSCGFAAVAGTVASFGSAAAPLATDGAKRQLRLEQTLAAGGTSG